MRCVVVLATIFSLVSCSEFSSPKQEYFFMMCGAGDNLSEFSSTLDTEDDNGRNLLFSRTPSDETCLHLCGIHGNTGYLKNILDRVSEDERRELINFRVREEKNPLGLNMPVLSWFVYGLHKDAVNLLLESGADANAIFFIESGELVTCKDIIDRMLEQSKEGEGSWNEMIEIRRSLESFGGKGYERKTPSKKKEDNDL